jgi:predicted MFS family arabinose efflux permease
VTLPSSKTVQQTGFHDRTTRGIRICLATPRLRGLLALNLSVAAAGAMVIVNTVVLVKGRFGLSEPHVALALAAFGGGSIAATLVLPQLLGKFHDRPIMIAGASLLSLGMLTGPLVASLPVLALLWIIVGAGYSLTLTPTGRLLRRSARTQDGPAVFAAQFSLSSSCWLVTYPLAGRIGAGSGLDAAFLIMAALSTSGLVLAIRLWPANDPHEVTHTHPDLPPDHPHLAEHRGHHRHHFVIDDLHKRWSGD